MTQISKFKLLSKEHGYSNCQVKKLVFIKRYSGYYIKWPVQRRKSVDFLIQMVAVGTVTVVIFFIFLIKDPLANFSENCHFSHTSPSFNYIEETFKKESDYNNKDSQDQNSNADQNNNSMVPILNLTNDISKNSPNLIENSVDVKEYHQEFDFQKEKISIDSQVMCGTCKRVLERKENESFCNILKDHYLDCFLEKDGDHVKCVKMKAALDVGQMYWCKSCVLIFEKPWSLFQHMADKAKGTKVQRWEKKVHLDWIDSVAGLMAGHDLELFSLAKLRTDLRNLLADQYTVEEEMELAAAAMVQLLAPITANPWRIHQREVMRKIENLHRQLVRRASATTELTRAALASGLSSVPANLNRNRIPPQNFNGSYKQIQNYQSSMESKLRSSDPTSNKFECNKTRAPNADGHIAGASGDHPESRTFSTLGEGNLAGTKVNLDNQLNCNKNGRSAFNLPTQSFRCAIASLNNEQGISLAKNICENSKSDLLSESSEIDLTCGFTEEEVEELRQQGIKPWDSEASAALAVLRGEMDHLLH